MKAVLLAGGYGTRLSEETGIVPKPLVEIGGRPILWHIMKIYAAHGITDFVICCGYKGHMIKDYFLSYFHRNSDITIDVRSNQIELHRPVSEPWRVTMVDTGLETMTGGRIKRIREHIGDETFCLTYGDGVSDIDIGSLVAFHKEQGVAGTVTAVRLPGRFGALDLSEGTRVNRLREKSMMDGQTINGGFFVLEPSVFDYIDGDATVWEEEPLQGLVRDGQLAVYRHEGFWQNMDTLRDKTLLQGLWEKGKAPWKIWD
ncbi:glucose-1-phosphate cytidylyltransferase [Rhodobacter sphaeroides]|jgi:glucose-1-phosphate cytidylyltransferase|uniref:Glucose-1-phosphate cytidylyltransferase n=2 Tax=Cereibacter sphaeroides TaxID=1063 RepID=Q3J6A4_CERS4|nr:glucose-1-phosphate cytidylyltransferase [Cereibacter sphaeroides]ABN75308.1 glucose-1-phosphate cytidylyltransferase [Cereibacter sphaeroides ATCC 17029]EKX58902.1 Glucose-1-phosphate cytidylyltransferase [Rhodobacter sp. AKP1]ABA77680.1 putative glucose-1-phosphate cytidylyltransferase [Cereibacter sphaeroides 2.4.1]AMJ46081.1 glucose-1-phosphate cytidylyltransferase [Cereibacter sphaeroides]ANS32793.1 glucose-1-phosphate cytidylyltransferase [Cereibacter sphaeroides]